MTARLAGLLAVAFFCGSTTVAGAADTVISTSSSATGLTAYEDTVAWSERADKNRWRLVIRAGGERSRARVPSIRHPYSADLGPSGGRVVAVYARCTDFGDPAQPSDCDLYRYDLQKRTESRLERASTKGCDEVAPSIWKSRLVFYRGGPNCRGGVYEQRGRAPIRRIHAVRADDNQETVEVLGTDTRRDAISFVERRSPISSVSIESAIWLRPSESATFTRIANTVASSGASNVVDYPGFAGRFLYWSQSRSAEEGGFEAAIDRRPIVGGSRERADRAFNPRGEFAFARSGIYYQRAGVKRADAPEPAFAPFP